MRGGDEVTIQFVSAVPEPLQGLALDCDGCTATIVGASGRRFQLWAATAPPFVPVEITRARAGARLSIFNVWSGGDDGPMLYRLNDAAIAVDALAPDAWRLSCSDGVGPYDPADLIVEITVRGRSKRPALADPR